MSSILKFSRPSKALPSARRFSGVRSETTRSFLASTSRRDLVAPPDPISHMRPVLYDDPPSQLPAPYLRHPYSLSEFQTSSSGNVSDHKLQFKLLRQQLDSLHQSFWLDSNTRFYAAKEEILSSLPESASARDKEEALSVFYRQWVILEKERTDAYTEEWRRRNMELITIGGRVEYHSFKNQLARVFKRPETQ